MSTILNHSDTVNGTTIFDDGTKVYWTEGRGSEIIVLKPDGIELTIQPWREWTEEEVRIMDEEERVEQEADEYRQMTLEEEDCNG